MTGNPRNAMVCATPYLQKEFGEPRFFIFYVFNRILSFSTGSQNLKTKSVRGKFLGANVLKDAFEGKYKVRVFAKSVRCEVCF